MSDNDGHAGKRLPFPLGAPLLVAALFAAAPAAAATLTRGPYLQLLTTHSVTVAWNTDVAAACSLTIRPLDGSPTTIGGDTGTVCAIAVDGLVPGARYGYVPNADGVPLRTESVFHADDPTAPFTMLVFGDSGEPGPSQIAVRDRLLATPADVIVHTGDMVYPAGLATDFDPAFFTPYADLIRQLVLWPCLGNHDYVTAAGQPWRDAFYTPANNPAANENYYSFDVGNAHVVVLNSNQSTAPGSAQYTFLDHDLASTSAPWKFVVFHHTIYSSGITHGSNLVIRAELVPLFDAHAVDMVFMGHEHNYERTLPLQANQVVPQGTGTVYVTTGGGAKNLYPLGPPGFFTAYAESVHHFVRVAVDGETLTEEMIAVDGTVRDSMTLVKNAGGTVPTTTTTSTTTSTTTTPTSSTTTTSTTIVGATTSTTLPAAPVAACGVIDCDDGNPCTIDICTPGLGCRHDPVDFAALRHGIESDVVVRACIGQRVPPVVTGLIRRARAQVDQAAHATNPRRARRLVGRALQHLRQSRRLVAAAGARGHLSAPCAADLGTRIQTAEERGACL
ncbi:MAG: hypothetical protein E6J79_03615 [Deltaproteobacteria bacterium]|nr:MAG: hypothetical protein E6J79_03615 [Deltaproteobacteria bacterium]